MSKFIDHSEIIDTGDAFVPTNGETINVKTNISFYVRISELTGTIDAAVLQIQYSADGVNWDNSGISWTFGVGENVHFQHNIPICSMFMRLQVTTESTIASTATINVQAK